VLLAAPSLSGQTARKLTRKEMPPSAFKLVSIKVTGTKRYQPKEVIGLSGLQLGQTVSEDDFKRTAQLLGETGVFSNVVYSYQYAPEGTKLELQLTDGGEFVAARFDNFVWFSDQELMDKLRERVPLFNGELPVAGRLTELVSDALQALLIEHGVPGRADYLRSAPVDGPIEAIVFSVSGVDVRVRDVSFAGAGADELPLLQAAAKQMQGQEYGRSALRPQADLNLLPVYLARGCLKAKIADAEAKVVQSEAQETRVDVTFRVDPGRQYKLTQMQWVGNTIFPTEKLRPLIHLQPGQPANAVQLTQDLDAVPKLYGTRGYMAASAHPVAQMDDAQSTVSYQLQVKEGDLYHMGELEIVGLDSRTMYRVLDEWKLRGGDAYDSSYAQRFLSGSVKGLLPMGDWDLKTRESLNERDKTVDVTLRFDPRTPR
jgi:outer membrane protein insertion porin family